MVTIKIITDKTLDITINTAHEEIGYRDIIEQIDRFYKGHITRNVIWDFTHTDKTNLSEEEIRQIALRTIRAGKARQNGCNAIVVRKGLQYGLAACIPCTPKPRTASRRYACSIELKMPLSGYASMRLWLVSINRKKIKSKLFCSVCRFKATVEKQWG